jgi:hypothetical protein
VHVESNGLAYVGLGFEIAVEGLQTPVKGLKIPDL